MNRNINFEKLYAEYHPKILSFIKSKISSLEDAEDITSAVFEKAFKGIDNFRWQGVPISSWLYKIARNTLIDYYRKKKEIFSGDKIESARQSPDMEQNIISELRFEQILQQLNTRERGIVYMKFFEGHPNKNIAKKLKITENNVAIIVHRIIKKLRNEEKLTQPSNRST